MRRDRRSRARREAPALCFFLGLASCAASGGRGTASEPGAPSADSPDVDAPSVEAALPPITLENVGGQPDARCVADASLAQKTDYAKAGPYQTASFDITFEDTSRPIPKTDTHPAAPSRSLVTTIYYPSSGPAPLFGDAPVAKGGPFPLIMYSHGFSSTRGEAESIGTRAASYGYIVVAPDFPLSNLLANDGHPEPTDAPNQAGDVSFLIDRMIALSKQSGHVLANAVDDSRIGATGVSMGGLTTLLVSFHPKLLDARIKATAPIAGLSSFFTDGFYHTRELPMLLVHGDLDAFIDYELNSRAAWERAKPNARLMTIARGTHAAFAVSFDPLTVALLNALMGMPGSDPSNPDGFGCGGVSGELEGRVPSFPPGLGGAENFIDEDQVGDSLNACAGNEYTFPAMDAREQVGLAASAVVSFFEAHLSSSADTRQDGCRYLLHQLPKHPAVTIE